MNPPFLFVGSSHPVLAEEVSGLLGNLASLAITRFPDGELFVEVQENVRGQDVFVLQSIAINPDRFLFELLVIIDALKRASARSITAILPYLGYCRQDRKNKYGVPITAKLVANLIATAGAHQLITFDLHADQIEGFFDIPVDHLRCQSLLCEAVKGSLIQNSIAVAPDIGSIKVAEAMAKLLKIDLAIIKKQRLNSFDVKGLLIGEVANKNVLIIDDLCSTAGTLVAAANLCRESGARKMIAAVTHGLFVDDAIKKIKASALESIFVTNTIPFDYSSLGSLNFSAISIAPMIVDAIQRACHAAVPASV